MTAEAVDDDYIDEDGMKSTSVVWFLIYPVLFRFVEFMPLQSKGRVFFHLMNFYLQTLNPFFPYSCYHGNGFFVLVLHCHLKYVF
jgi:hypothetical protein